MKRMLRWCEGVGLGLRNALYEEAVVRKGGVLVVGGKTEGKERNGVGVTLDENGEY